MKKNNVFYIPPENFSKNAPLKKDLQIPLELLCKSYGTTIKSTTVRAAVRRGSIFVLDIGKVDHPACFIADPPTQQTEGQKYNTTVVPNGWKSATISDGTLWLLETRIADECLEYRFLVVDDKGKAISTGCEDHWEKSLTAAYTTAFFEKNGELPESPNGRLIAGIVYENPQKLLRDHFRQEEVIHDLSDNIKSLVSKWLLDMKFEISPILLFTPESKSTKKAKINTDEVLLDEELETFSHHDCSLSAYPNEHVTPLVFSADEDMEFNLADLPATDYVEDLRLEQLLAESPEKIVKTNSPKLNERNKSVHKPNKRS